MYLNSNIVPWYSHSRATFLSYTYFTTPSQHTRLRYKKKKRCNHINLKTYFDKGRTAIIRSNWNIYLYAGEEKKMNRKLYVWQERQRASKRANVIWWILLYVRLPVWLRVSLNILFVWIDVSHSHIVYMSYLLQGVFIP